MRFYNKQHKDYYGIDLHARKMYVCIIVFPFLNDIVIGVECVEIKSRSLHALYMKAIRGGKTKNDKIDSYTIEDKSRNKRVTCQNVEYKDGFHFFQTLRSIREAFS